MIVAGKVNTVVAGIDGDGGRRECPVHVHDAAEEAQLLVVLAAALAELGQKCEVKEDCESKYRCLTDAILALVILPSSLVMITVSLSSRFPAVQLKNGPEVKGIIAS